MSESWRCGSARFLSSSSSLQLLRSTAHLTPRASRSQEALQTLRREISLADRVLLYRARPLPAEHEVTAFLTHLATKRHVSTSTQNQALSALLFLYRHVLDRELGDLDAVRAKRHRKVPVVLTRTEVQQVLEHLQGPARLVVLIIYSSGLRLREGLQLRVKDLDFQYRQVIVCDGKGGKSRVSMLPERLKIPLLRHLESVRRIHARDLRSPADSL